MQIAHQNAPNFTFERPAAPQGLHQHINVLNQASIRPQVALAQASAPSQHDTLPQPSKFSIAPLDRNAALERQGKLVNSSFHSFQSLPAEHVMLSSQGSTLSSSPSLVKQAEDTQSVENL